MLALVAALLATSPAAAGPLRNVKVAVQFERTSDSRTEGADASGRLIVTERKVSGRGRVTVEDTSTRIRQTTSIFSIIQDGAEGRLLVATEVPYPEVAFFYDYATGRGYLARGVQFHQVGAALIVRPVVLPNGSIRVRVTPHITYLAANGGGGEVEFTEATTELIVRSGVPVTMAGAATGLHAVTRRILGYRAAQTAADTTMVLTATVQ
jgi:hypothetical protein